MSAKEPAFRDVHEWLCTTSSRTTVGLERDPRTHWNAMAMTSVDRFVGRVSRVRWERETVTRRQRRPVHRRISEAQARNSDAQEKTDKRPRLKARKGKTHGMYEEKVIIEQAP